MLTFLSYCIIRMQYNGSKPYKMKWNHKIEFIFQSSFHCQSFSYCTVMYFHQQMRCKNELYSLSFKQIKEKNFNSSTNRYSKIIFWSNCYAWIISKKNSYTVLYQNFARVTATAIYNSSILFNELNEGH